MSKREYKYSNLAEIIEAFKRGELTQPMMLDNDCTLFYSTDENGEANERVWDGGTPSELLGEALTLLGVPWEHV